MKRPVLVLNADGSRSVIELEIIHYEDKDYVEFETLHLPISCIYFNQEKGVSVFSLTDDSEERLRCVYNRRNLNAYNAATIEHYRKG